MFFHIRLPFCCFNASTTWLLLVFFFFTSFRASVSIHFSNAQGSKKHIKMLFSYPLTSCSMLVQLLSSLENFDFFSLFFCVSVTLCTCFYTLHSYMEHQKICLNIVFMSPNIIFDGGSTFVMIWQLFNFFIFPIVFPYDDRFSVCSTTRTPMTWYMKKYVKILFSCPKTSSSMMVQFWSSSDHFQFFSFSRSFPIRFHSLCVFFKHAPHHPNIRKNMSKSVFDIPNHHPQGWFNFLQVLKFFIFSCFFSFLLSTIFVVFM